MGRQANGFKCAKAPKWFYTQCENLIGFPCLMLQIGMVHVWAPLSLEHLLLKAT